MDEDVKNIYDTMKALDLDALKREGKDFPFTDVYPLVKNTFSYIEQMEQFPEFWSFISLSNRESYISELDQFLRTMQEIRDFNPNEGDPGNRRQQIIERVRSRYNWLAEHFFPILDLYIIKDEIHSGKIADLAEKAQKAVNEVEESKKKGEALVESLQQATAVAGAGKFAGIFGNQSTYHKDIARNWLIVLGLFTAGSGGYLYWIISELTKSIQSGQKIEVTIQIFFAKALLLSVFSVVFYQIAKNYNAQMHQYILNKHRENSLLTFRAFVESTNDERIKDQILIQATRAIFRAGDTGYVVAKEKIEATPSILPIITDQSK